MVSIFMAVMPKTQSIGGVQSTMIHPMYFVLNVSRRSPPNLRTPLDAPSPPPPPAFVIKGLETLGSVSCLNAILQNLLALRSLRKEMMIHEFTKKAALS